ncbi:MAG TPA: hypothetical protein VGR37_24480 [Longimicrobiaceae bacterium]|nr:hypothetical protein [Longimicrobiaceae bacterium]
MPVETLRASVRAYAEDVGYRTAAEQVGMSLGGLHAFIGGTVPHERTIRKLQAWYVATAGERGEELTPELVRTALGLLVRHLPERDREDAVRGMLADLRKRTEAAKAPVPRWLR